MSTTEQQCDTVTAWEWNQSIGWH